MVIAQDASHTFSTASKSLVAPTDFFLRVFFNPVGNNGLNPDDPSHRLMSENGHKSKKWPNLTIKMAIIQNSLLDKSLP